MPDTSKIRTEQDGPVRIVTIDRPEKKNAFTSTMYSALTDALTSAQTDASVRVVLLRGTDGAFTAGNDLRDFLASPPSGADSPVVRFLYALTEMQKPLIAAVEGPAIGIGTTLLLHCDLVYASRSAVFALPFVALGLCPEAASSLLLPRLVGLQRATELLLLGEVFDAEHAHAIGIVNEVLEPDALYGRALDRAQRLAALPPAALRASRALLRDGLREEVTERLETELEIFATRLVSPEAREALSAFVEKRPPDFTKFD